MFECSWLVFRRGQNDGYYHTYSLEWAPPSGSFAGQLDFFVDGIQQASMQGSHIVPLVGNLWLGAWYVSCLVPRGSRWVLPILTLYIVVVAVYVPVVQVSQRLGRLARVRHVHAVRRVCKNCVQLVNKCNRSL